MGTPSERPSLPVTPLDALGPFAREEVYIDERTFVVYRPKDSDRLLDYSAVPATFAADEYVPYWTDLWPAARMLAKFLLRENWPPGLHALEIGCGLGLPGIAALAQGFHVTFSDYDATAVRAAADNARANGFRDFDTLVMDWRYPPEDCRWPVILGADLIYEMRHVAPIAALIEKLLAPEGVCLLTDQDRVPSHVVRETLTAEGLPFTTRVLRAGEPGGRRVKGTLYRITR